MEDFRCSDCQTIKPPSEASNVTGFCKDCAAKKRPKLNINGRLNKMKSKAKQQARELLWRKGDFTTFLLNSYQQEMLNYYDGYNKDNSKLFTFLCSRRIGKSWLLSTLALRQCMMNPGSRVLYLSTTTDQVIEIVDQTFSPLLESCPSDLKPVYKAKTNKYVFPNGSEIRIKGMDKVGPHAIRGVKAHLIVLDEFCFMKHLVQLIDSVLMAMAIATDATIVMGSTPPDTPGHESIEIINRCEITKSIIKKDIYVAKDVLYSNKQIEAFAQEAGGAESTTFRREYLCEIVTDDELAVLPSCTEAKISQLVSDPPQLDYLPDRYVAMDIGFRDQTAILFGYWDYVEALLVIEDEVILPTNKAPTNVIAEVIQAKEKELWGKIPPFRRICDTDPRVIHDLRELHGIHFKATRKDNKEAQINQTNIMCINNQIVLHPRLQVLPQQMRYAVWNTSRTGFQRSKAMGHYDAVDALLYMVRNIKRGKNPIPDQTHDSTTHLWHGQEKDEINEGNADKVLHNLFTWR